MNPIPFYKPSIGQEEIDEVVDTLKSGWLTTGPKVAKFEADFARYINCKHAVAVNSCTGALHLALEAIGLKSGDSVLVPTMTFAATAEVVRYFKARPILVDCNELDFTMDMADAESKIKKSLDSGENVRAIMPVHYGGQIGDTVELRKLTSRYKLKRIEDAAHCCPAYYTDSLNAPWKMVGTEADISCYSFYANKTITTGEGGMACTNNDEYAERMRIMSLHGISKDAWQRFSAQGSWYYEITAPGFKYNLTDIAAAIGIHQLRKANALHHRRAGIAESYARQLGAVDELILPTVRPHRIHSWHLYVIRIRPHLLSVDRARIIDDLKQAGIGTSVHWLPLHMHPYYRKTYGYKPTDLPQAARLYQDIISLPIYPEMQESDVNRVCKELKRILAKHRKTPVRAARNPKASIGHQSYSSGRPITQL